MQCPKRQELKFFFWSPSNKLIEIEQAVFATSARYIISFENTTVVGKKFTEYDKFTKKGLAPKKLFKQHRYKKVAETDFLTGNNRLNPSQ